MTMKPSDITDTLNVVRLSKTLLLSDGLMMSGDIIDKKTQQLDLSLIDENEPALDVYVYCNTQKIKAVIDKYSALSSQKDSDGLDVLDKIYLDIGVDEAGRGPLLGSVLVGAVILPPELSGEFLNIDLNKTAINHLNDSKKISEKKRDNLYSEIESTALAYSYVDVSAQVIDEINILQASLLGMKVATQMLMQQLAHELSHEQLSKLSIRALFDGNKLPKLDYDFIQKIGLNFTEEQAIAVVKGDAKFTSIAMGSVVAKVERDKQMYAMSKKYPQYGIDKHKGYPTKAHFIALQDHGVLAEHRRSFAPVRKRLESL